MIYPMREFEGYAIAASDGTLGSVKDIYFDDAAWIVRYFVVETGSWLNGRRVLLSARSLTAMPSTRGLSIEATREQVRHCPPVETELPVSRQREQALFDYFGWPPYWGMAPLAGGGIAPGALLATPQPPVATPMPHARDTRTGTLDPERTSEGDPHLRSAREVRGYSITARDGSIGKLEDLLVDSDTWDIHAVAVDTRKWLPGRTVLIPPRAVNAVRWTETDLVVDLTREQIKESPSFDTGQTITTESTDKLLSYYTRQRRGAVSPPEVH